MSMSKSSYSQYNRVTWEDAEFPILCQTCLGDNPYLRMMKDKFGKECNICKRPFTNFRWCPGKGMRYKSVEVCQTCAKIKNICQTCLLDLEYGLPVQVRDHALQLKDDIPKQGANRDYYVQNMERESAIGDGASPVGAVGKALEVQSGKQEMLAKLARPGPFYRRNLPHLCSFFIKGECKRGEECPYRHEKPTDPDDPLSEQNMRDRYYGANDPVAEKMLNRFKAMPTLRPPEDKHVTTLYCGNLGEEGLVTESDLRNYFYQFGEIRNIHVVGNKGIAFVEFTSRDGAEMAANKAYNKLTLKNRRITIRWGRPQASRNAAQPENRNLPPVPGLPPPMDFFNLGSNSGDASTSGGSLLPPGPMPTMGSAVLPSGWIVGTKRQDASAGSSSSAVASKKSRQDDSVPTMPFAAPRAMPPMPPPANYPPAGVAIPPPGQLSASRISAKEMEAKAARLSAAGIHYPSQDPQHLGAKDLVD